MDKSRQVPDYGSGSDIANSTSCENNPTAKTDTRQVEPVHAREILNRLSMFAAYLIKLIKFTSFLAEEINGRATSLYQNQIVVAAQRKDLTKTASLTAWFTKLEIDLVHHS